MVFQKPILYNFLPFAFQPQNDDDDYDDENHIFRLSVGKKGNISHCPMNFPLCLHVSVVYKTPAVNTKRQFMFNKKKTAN